MCGVTSQVFAILLSILKPYSYRSYELRAEDKLTLFLMKLKLGISFNALACLFSVHKSTSRKIFHLTLQKLCFGETLGSLVTKKQCRKHNPRTSKIIMLIVQ